MLSKLIQDNWYHPNILLTVLLLPLTLLYCAISKIRRYAYQHHWIRRHTVSVPVLVVGNISVGGTGKTPLVIALVEWLTQQGYRPGIISRGYGGKATQWPQAVTPDSDPASVGDEAVLMAQRAQCPIYVGPDRVSAANALLSSTNCDIIVSDDGLQHYRLVRDIEIAVIDGQRRFGNGLCLPAGPLRETPLRLKSVDLVVNNGANNGVNNGANVENEYSMRLVPGNFHNLKEASLIESAACFQSTTNHAVSGIGNNSRFFNVLENMAINIQPHAYNDHYNYTANDLDFGDNEPVIMTEKDAVKCRQFAKANYWYLPVEAQLDESFYHRLGDLLKQR